MSSKLGLLLAGCFLFAPLMRAQDNPLNDPDLQDALKQAKELEKQSGPAKPVKMSDLKKQAAEIEAQQKEDEQKEKAALKEQLEAPGAVALPAWTPATPQFHATSSPAKKIVDDEVKIVMTGTSALTPDELAEAWVAAIADKKINHVLNTNSSNGDKSTTLFLDTREGPREKVRMHASRPVGAKMTEVEISSPLPKPGDDSE